MILVGTSGFSYRDWAGPLYPPELRQDEYLSHYARHFNFVEINYTYYRMPAPASLEGMCSKVPEGFLFTVKAPGSLTHQREGDYRELCRTFLEALEPMVERKMFGGLLLQFPFSFHYNRENRIYLDRVLRELNGTGEDGSGPEDPLPIFVEFRNDRWHHDTVYGGLDRRRTGIVVTDQPELKGLPRFDPRHCGRDAYFRFHGRNGETWWTGDNASRYDYRYSEQELLPLADAVAGEGKQARRTFAAFNNHRKGKAVENARQLQMLLER